VFRKISDKVVFAARLPNIGVVYLLARKIWARVKLSQESNNFRGRIEVGMTQFEGKIWPIIHRFMTIDSLMDD
jgi:hypothetical protein